MEIHRLNREKKIVHIPSKNKLRYGGLQKIIFDDKLSDDEWL